MKTTLLILTILFTAAVMAQTPAPVISSQPMIVRVPDHPQTAEIGSMGREHSLLGGGSYSYAQGERPLWEFGPVSAPPKPLGDVARELRREKQSAKKAEIVFEKQGS